jgi:hypothetical protein
LKKAKKTRKLDINKSEENDEKDENLVPVSSVDKSAPFDSYSINLWDEKYRKDTSPLVNFLSHGFVFFFIDFFLFSVLVDWMSMSCMPLSY